jgi:4-hydroxyphenylpyruvate dioxygenase
VVWVRDLASHVVRQGDITMVLTSALQPDHPVARHAWKHGDGVAVIALEVPDAAAAFAASTERGARAAFAPTEEHDEHGVLRHAAVHIYGDTLLRFVERAGYRGPFAPGFVALEEDVATPDIGLRQIDHIVGNVELGHMNEWVDFFSQALGFSQLVHFDDKTIATEYSA